MDNASANPRTNLFECSCCGKPIEKDAAYIVSDRYFCEDCYEGETFRCEQCGKRCLLDEGTTWGDILICPECLEEYCPSFDEEENEEETAEAYEEMKKAYIGRRTRSLFPGIHEMEYTDYDSDPVGVTYSLSITIDDHHTIADISRLRASIMLWEDIKSSDWRSYPIYSEDYEDKVEALFDEYDIEFIDIDEDDIDD